ncbi:MAG TPA: ABC transporter permease, partial [Chitinophagaceae bacterium]|nr:ABC transporter permease [Chitinophagaceae bacterium]
MIKNYFKTAFRNLLRRKNYTIINIAGLAAGIAICLVIFIVIRYEMSFDDYHKKKDRIYRVLTEYHHADSPDIFYGKGVPSPLPLALKTNFPQVEKVATVYSEGNDQIQVLDDNGQPIKKFKEEHGVFFTEPSLFDIFDFKWLAGNASSLKDPNSVILTQTIAEKYFGDWQFAIGKTIKWNNKDILKITGILADIPGNTDLQLKVVISFGTGYTADFAKSTNWDGTGSSYGCYILLPRDVSASSFNTRLRAFVKKMKSPENKDSHILQPLNKIHYDTKTGDFSNRTISPGLIRALWLIGAFILLIACVNFINLSTAQAVNRSKEVGIRKVLGSNKTGLKIQFITETFLIVFISILAAVVIAILTLPFIGKVLSKPLSFDITGSSAIILFLLSLGIVVTALAGFYPSIVLSRFNPINALKNKMAVAGTKGISLRRGLVVFQFVIAQALIIGTLIIVKQMNYFTRQPLGFDKTAIVNIPFPGDSIGTSKLDYLRKELAGIKNIQNVSFSSNTPVEDDNDMWSTFKFDHAAKETDFYAITKFADDQYIPTYKLPLIAGRNLQPSDTAREFLVSEKLVKNLGIINAQDILNKEINLWGSINGKIVGVIKDYNDRSFRRGIDPVLITTVKRGYNQAGIKLITADVSSAMTSIEKIWGQTFPEFVFEYKFLDDKIESFYKQENQLSSLYKIFAVIAIFLSCLGLYGLASFMAVQRIKEVGIRKVLGASVSSVVYLFSKEFIILITIAFIIASPVVWYFMDKWLQDYVYRINISWWIFIVGGISAIIIALITVSFQAIKAAIANPVKSLRT